MFSTVTSVDAETPTESTPVEGLKARDVKEMEKEFAAVLTPENSAIEVYEPWEDCQLGTVT
jgi:hypothetical protein